MKKFISIIALFAILFSSMGTSISVYAETISISSWNNQEDWESIQIQQINDPLLDRINWQWLAWAEVALLYTHGKITTQWKIYIINQNATASEKTTLRQTIPTYDGRNADEIKRLKDQKIKIIEDIFNRPINQSQYNYLRSNPIAPKIWYIEMGLSWRELANIWQTKLTTAWFDYLLEQNGSTREKRIAWEIRVFTNQRDNAETEGNQAVLGFWSGIWFTIMVRIISRWVTKTQLKYMIGHNMLSWIEVNDDITLNNQEEWGEVQIVKKIPEITEYSLIKREGNRWTGWETAMNVLRSKIKNSWLSYIIRVNATNEEKVILNKPIPTNETLKLQLKKEKQKVLTNVFSKQLSTVGYNYLVTNNLFYDNIYNEVEMWLSGAQLVKIAQNQITEEWMRYLKSQNYFPIEKTILEEIYSENRDNQAGLWEGWAVTFSMVGLGEEDLSTILELYFMLVSRWVTKSQLQHMKNNNMITGTIPDYKIPGEVDNEINVDLTNWQEDEWTSTVVPINSETPQEKTARLKREAEQAEEKARQQQQEEQVKLGWLAERDLYNLLKNRDYTQDWLMYLINLRGNLTKTEKAVLLRENEIKSKIANKSIAIRTKIDGIYNKLFQKLAKNGLSKTQYQEFAILNIQAEEEKVEKEAYNIDILLQKQSLTKLELKYIIKNNYISNQWITSILNSRGYSRNIEARRICWNNPNEQTCLRVLIRWWITETEYYFLKRDWKITNTKFVYTYVEEEDSEDDEIIWDVLNDSEEILLEELNTTNDFLEKVGNQWNKNYKVNFKDIRANWKVVIYKKFDRPSLFPKKIILPEGINFKLKDVNLETIFNKNTTIKNKIAQNNLNLKVKSFEPQLKVLWDRLVFTKKTQINFKTKTELETIQTKLWKDIWISNAQLQELKTQLDKWNEQWRIFYKNDRKINNKFSKFNNTTLSKFAKININDTRLINWLIADCKKINWNSSNKCNKNYIENQAEKTITVEDKVEYWLIPPTFNEVQSWNYLLKRQPGTFDLSAVDINNRFKKLRIINNIIKKKKKKEYTKLWNWTTTNIYALTWDREYCKATYTKQLDIDTCIAQKSELNKKTIAYYDKQLLNWFTLWSEKSVWFSTSYSVWWTKIFALSVKLYYAFGFGIRIPINVWWSISDNLLIDYSDKNKFKTDIFASTFDGNKDFYHNIWLADDQIFDWQEFVLRAWAGIKVHLFVKYLVDTNIDLGLITLLVLLQDYDFLNNAWIHNSEDVVKLWIPASSLGNNNKIQIFGKSISLADFIADDPADFVCSENETEVNEWYETKPCSIIEIKQWLNWCSLVPYHVEKIKEVSQKVYEYCSNSDTHEITSSKYKVLKTRKELLMYLAFHNSLDLWKNFTPPFGWDHRMKLFDVSTPAIPITDPTQPFVLLWKIGLKSFLDGGITVKCNNINATWWCPLNDAQSSNAFTANYDASRLHINKKKIYSNSEWIAILPEELLSWWKFSKDGTWELKKENKLWKYANFWVKFTDFRYHPKVDFTLYAKAWAKAVLPLIWKKTFWTKDLDIYTYSISSDDIYLSKHKWTDWDFEMTNKNKIYSVEWSLGEITNINIRKIKKEWKVYEDKYMLSIFPKINSQGSNKTYYYVWNKGDLKQLSCANTYWLKEYKWEPIEIFLDLTSKDKLKDNNKWIWNIKPYEYVIKAISCDIMRLKETRVKTKVYKIDNHYFDPYIIYSWKKYEDTHKLFFTTRKIIAERWKTINTINLELWANNFDKNSEYINYILTKWNSPTSTLNCYSWRRYNKNQNFIIWELWINWDTSRNLVPEWKYYFKMVRCTRYWNRWYIASFTKEPVVIWKKANLLINQTSFEKNNLEKNIINTDTVWNLWINGIWIGDKLGGNNPIKDYWRDGWQYWWPQTMNFNWGPIPPIDEEKTTSSDEYVNEKLQEINDCFINTYNSHLDNLNKTIKNFEKTRDSSKNEKTKAKYQKAINKLNEIKRLFEVRYSYLMKYKVISWK